MFEAVMHDLRWRLHHRGTREPAPVPSGMSVKVTFHQQDQRLFEALTGERAPPPPAGSAIHFQQRDRHLFAAVLGGAGEVVPAQVAAVAVWQRTRVLFDPMVERQRARRAVRRGAWILGATAFQVFFFTSMALLGAALAARSHPVPAVEVTLVQPRRPVPPPPAAPPRAARRAPAVSRPSAPIVKPAPPTALVQPREIAEAMKAPDPNEPIEAYEEDLEGVEGGVVGGVPGYVEPPPAGSGGVMEAPVYVTTGFRAPAEVVPGCVGRSVRLPRDLAGYAAGQVVVKFAVGRDGTVGLVRLMTPVPDQRIFEAIRQALASCRWRAGADAQGQPVTLWVVLPLRFAAE
ncbi:MAG TPA: energy transducer TonB [Anaeromyxobacteraceae bacterium]|nr:energy transducer TonB [Anaeromyxobacteraceae bacterium]